MLASKSLLSLPLLVLHFDEGSPNQALYCWMQYQARLRVIGVRDIYHREWNDVTLALRQAGLWRYVVLSSILFNLPYGPWNGGAWFGKLCESARDLAARDGTGGALFKALYPFACRDAGEEATYGSHMSRMVKEMADAAAFKRKGTRAALRRWFSWMQAAMEHDPTWHSRLLAILYVGLRTRAYSSLEQLPFWRSGDVVTGGEVALEDSEDEAEHRDAAAAAHAAPQVSTASASTDKPLDEEESNKRVSAGDEEVQKLRRKCKNTFFLAAGI